MLTTIQAILDGLAIFGVIFGIMMIIEEILVS